MALRRETRGLSVKIYFFILAHLVALLSEVNILFNLFTSGKLCRRRLALATSRANFNVARTSAVCLAHRPVLKLKILPDNKRLLSICSFCLSRLLSGRIDLPGSGTISCGFDADNPWVCLTDDEYMNNFLVDAARRRGPPTKIDIP